jgi:putative ABC transport system permease protein
MLETADDVLSEELSYFSFLRQILVQIACLGLLLSAVGVYGVVANLASERTREVGIRMALGAGPGSLVWLFLKNGVQLAFLGAAVGLGASYFLVAILTRWLPVLPGRDPWVVLGVAVFLGAVALVACGIPALRATRVNPTIALRAE